MEKSIIEKLKLDRYESGCIIGTPEWVDVLEKLKWSKKIEKDKKYQGIMFFVFSMDEVKKRVREVNENKLVEEGGGVFFVYPKKNNKKFKEYIERDAFLSELDYDNDGFIMGTKIKFNRMVSFDETFTCIGMKVEAKKKVEKSSKTSQCVDDYIEYIPEVEKQLLGSGVESVYENLTQGYRKDWARWIFSCKQEITKEKRVGEMIEILKKGYKTKNLYDQDMRKKKKRGGKVKGRITGIGGVFFKSNDTSKLKEWYSEKFKMDCDEHGKLFMYLNSETKELSPLQWSLFPKDTEYFIPSEKEFMINYTVENIEELVIELKEKGVEILDEIESYPYGKFVHVMDPEGNKIELWEPKNPNEI